MQKIKFQLSETQKKLNQSTKDLNNYQEIIDGVVNNSNFKDKSFDYNLFLKYLNKLLLLHDEDEEEGESFYSNDNSVR